MLLPITLSLLLAHTSVQESTLLPHAPEGWRFERLDFPLAFAPEIDYEGFEELRFAPGMFDAESESYFSYVLALRIEEAIRIDETFLHGFLTDYYVGLCEAVGESRNLDLDLDAIAVRVAPGSHGYDAQIDMFDAFVTGKELALDLEISVVAGKEYIDVLGLASPHPKTAMAWKELRGIARSWRAARAPQAFLNHLYFIPDAETYAAIVSSPFLNGGFAVFEERATVRPDTTYTGRYFYGRHTYFEFLKPEPDRGFAPGNTGIAFGLENAGDTKILAAGLKEKGIQTFAGPMKRLLDEEQLAWFEIMGIERATSTSRLDLFSMEYDPRFLDQWHPDLAPATDGKTIDRASVLQRYAARIGTTPDEALFQDVVEIHVRLPEKDRQRLVETCLCFGYTVESEAAETVCTGPGFGIRVFPPLGTEDGGIEAFVVRLREPRPARNVEIGAIRVEIEGDRATFRLPRS